MLWKRFPRSWATVPMVAVELPPVDALACESREVRLENALWAAVRLPDWRLWKRVPMSWAAVLVEPETPDAELPPS